MHQHYKKLMEKDLLHVHKKDKYKGAFLGLKFVSLILAT